MEIFIFLTVLLVFVLFTLALISDDWEGIKGMAFFAVLYAIAIAMIGD